jgi:hypothetical protein
MEGGDENGRGKITPEKAMKMLNSEGMNVSLEEAKAILDFMRKLANIAVSKFLEL